MAAGVLHAQITIPGPGVINTVAGGGTPSGSGDGGLATLALIPSPAAIAVDSSGNLYIVETSSNVIREVVAKTGIISTIAGKFGSSGYSGDGGPATNALLNSPTAVAVDSAGNVYIVDSLNSSLRKVTSAGIITTVVGGHGPGYGMDGVPAISAYLNNPKGVTVDSAGNLYIADTFNQRIRKVTASSGIITTIAGNGVAGFSGDNGAATSAELNGPASVALDTSGNIYINDSGNARIRKVTVSNGTITTIAGIGLGFPVGPSILANNTRIFPSGIAVDSGGVLYMADSGCIVQKVLTDDEIFTVAGDGVCGSSGDGGPAISAQIDSASQYGVVVDSAGNLYIADSGSNKIRAVGHSTPAVTIFAPSFASYGQSVMISASIPSGATGTVAFYDNGNLLGMSSTTPGTTGPPITYTTTSLELGTHEIIAEYLGNASYGAGFSAPVNLMIAQGSSATLNFQPIQPQTYGVFPFTVNASSASTGAITYSVLSGPATISGTTITLNGAGTVTLVASQAATASFTAETAWTSFTVGKASLTVSAGNATRTYGATNPTFSPVYGGFVHGDTATVLTGVPSLTTTATATSAPGSYAIAAAAGTLTATNYAFVFVNGTLNVAKASLTVTGGNATRTYGTANPAFTPIFSGFQNGDTVAVLTGAPSLTTTATAMSAVGSYPITAAAGTLTAANYVFVFVSGTLTVVKATPTVTASVVSSPVSYGTLATVNVQVSCNSACGNVDYKINGGEWGTVPLNSSGFFSAQRPSGDVPGTYSVTINYLGNGNYNSVTSNTVTFTVVKATPTVTASVVSSPVAYGTLATVNVQVSCNSACGNVDYKINGGEWGTVPLNSSGFFSAQRPSGDVPGTYSVTINYLGNGNYNSVTSNTVTFTVVKATPTVIASVVSSPVSYGTLATVNVQVSCNSACGNVDYKINGGEWGTVPLNSSGFFSAQRPSGDVPGTYSVTINYLGNGNYASATSNTVTFTVIKATPAISWVAPAGITYGAALSSTQLDATATGGSGALLGTFTYSPAAGTVLNAGAQTLSVTFTPANATDYVVTTKAVPLNVGKAGLTVTAGNASRAYGAANPTFTPAYSGFVHGDTASVLTGSPSLTTTATPSSTVGTYPISATAGTLTATNYVFVFVNGTLTVNKSAPIVTLGSSRNPSAVGGAVTFTATLPTTATGTVQFQQGGASLGSPVAISAGKSSYSTAALAVGSISITAVYSGDMNNSGNTSSALLQTVVADASISSISATSGPIGSTVTITGTNFGATQGSNLVTFNGVAASIKTWSNTSIAAAVPTGASSGNIAVSVDGFQSNGVPFTVGAPLTIALSCSPQTVSWNGQVTCTATLTLPNGSAVAPEGQLSFLDTGQLLGTVTLPTRTFTYTALSVGNYHKITANFATADFNYLSTQSSTFSQTVIYGTGSSACPVK